MKDIKTIFSRIIAPRVDYQPLIEVRIFKDALLHNLHAYQKQYLNLKFAPVLKSNAYGHGLVQVAKILDKEAIAFFMADSFYEALVLRRAGVKSKILILGYIRDEQILNNQLKNVSFGIIDFGQLRDIISKLKKRQSFHLKVDTGMHRQGILMEKIDEVVKLIKANKNFVLEGICSHFADADGESPEFTEKQIIEWNRIAKKFKENFSSIKYLHTSNSSGIYFSGKTDANVVRLGVGIYGMEDMENAKMSLAPVLEVRSIISGAKNIARGEKVGYGISFESIRPMKLATVPAGYYEGIDRRLSNKGFFKVNSQFCPIVGRVSMNMTTIDVSDIKEVELEQEVVVISAKAEDKNSVENMAKICGCLQREILVHIPSNLRRVVI